jgi:hypothetical protein
MATKPVIVGVDGPEESLRIMSASAELPRLHARHASPAEVAAALRGITARALDAAITRSEEVAPGRQDVIRGHPARVLASYSGRADLVVLGIDPARVLDHAHGPAASHDPHRRPRPGRRGPRLDPGAPVLAAQRPTLRALQSLETPAGRSSLRDVGAEDGAGHLV